jgi:hypothetical protein
MEQPNASLQLILPTDKRNPFFTGYQTEDGRFLHVYYGLERMEVIPAAADHPARRMLVARLYNAEVKVSALAELLQLDGSGGKMQLRLTDKSRITVQISDDSDAQPSSI